MTVNAQAHDVPSGDANAPAAVGSLLAWTFGLAPALLFVLTWNDEFSPLQQMARAYALPVVGAQLVVILISFREGLRLGRPKLLPLALLVAWGMLAWITAARAALLSPSLIRTGIWTIQVLFALAVVNLWHHRMLDLQKWRTATLTGLVLVFVLLVAFVATTDQTPSERVFGLPALGHVRWYGYYAVAAVGLAAPGFLRDDRIALLAAILAFALGFWTGTRGVVMATAAGLILCAILFRDFRSPRVWGRLALCALAGLVGALGLAALLPFEGMGPGSMARVGDSGRIEIWVATTDAIQQRPWLGWGEAQFREIFRDVWPLGQPHNVVLQVLLAWGAIGGLLCLALAIWTAPRFLKARSAEAAPFQCAALMLAAYSFIDGSLYYAHSLSLFTFCCAAAVAAGLPRNEPSG